MEVYIANLLRENSATTITIVRDDAATGVPQDLRKTNNEFRDDEEDELDQAPMVPTRKRSNDSLSEISKRSTVALSKGDRQKARALLLHKFRGLKLRYKRKNKVGVSSLNYGSSTSPQKKNDGEQAHHTVQSSPEDDTETKPQNERWDDIQLSPAPVSQLLLQNVDPAPTLPLRRRSDDNLVLHSTAESQTRGTISRRSRSASLNYAILPIDLRQGCFLDNTTMIVKEHMEHMKRTMDRPSSSLDDASLV